jgi:plastocyanin
MPFTWRININPNPGGRPTRPAVFEFDQPPDVETGDQVIWSNNDDQAHFPVPDPPDPTGVGSFMPTQIAPNSTSPGFAFGTAGTVKYHCTLHPEETGVIEVKENKPSVQV